MGDRAWRRAANTDRCEYGPLGNRATCICPFCAAWQRREQQRRARARRPSTSPSIDRAVKAAIVDRMFAAAYGQLRQTARALSAEYGVKASTIQTGWRRWAAARDPIPSDPNTGA